jgi:hypothetical protein
VLAFGALITMLAGASAGWLLSGSKPLILRRLLLAVVAGAFFAWCLLLASGVARSWQSSLPQVHEISGHFMLLLVAGATGLWLGGGLPKIRRPTRVIARLFFMLLLFYCCANNTWTGYYLGPSWFDPASNPAAELRFEILHQVAFPVTIGLLLAFWFGRLFVWSPRMGHESRAEPGATADGGALPASQGSQAQRPRRR